MNGLRRWVMTAAGVLGFAMSGPAADIVFKAGFEDESVDNFVTGFTGGAIAAGEYDFSVGKGALKCTVESITDVERYIKFAEADTTIGFHFKSCGVNTIRVLGGCVEDNENLYFTLTNVPQNVWAWAAIKVANWRNMIPRNGGPECPAGDKTGKKKTFRGVVFHLMNPAKEADQPTVYLDNIVLFSGADTKPPVFAGKPMVRADAQGRLLVWADAEDDTGVAYYRVIRSATADFKADAVTNTVVIPEFPLASGKAWYRVVAVDYAGNESAPSAPVAADEK